MRRYVQSMTRCLWVIAFALLIVRTADDHMQLCFDGQQLRSSQHVNDPAPVCHQSDSAHQDEDIEVLDPVLAKKTAQAEIPDPLLAISVVLFTVLPQSTTENQVVTQNPSPRLPDLFLPLLRGPPPV